MTGQYAAWMTVTDIAQACSPPPRTLDLWFLDLDDAPDAVTSVLDGKERERAARFVNRLDAARFAAAHGYLRTLLAASLDCRPQDIEFVYGGVGQALAAADWRSIRRLQSCPFTRQSGRGHSASRKRGCRHRSRTARWRIGATWLNELSPLESAAACLHCPSSIQLDGFFATGTRKEAIIKFWGQGLRADLQSFEVTSGPDQPSSLIWRSDPDLAPADLWAFKPCAGFWAAAACPTRQVSELRLFRLAS